MNVGLSVPIAFQGDNSRREKLLKKRFLHQVERWEKDTRYITMQESFNSPHFKNIIRMGKPIIPMILGHLQGRTSHLSIAIPLILGIDPSVPKKDRGRVPQIIHHHRTGALQHGFRTDHMIGFKLGEMVKSAKYKVWYYGVQFRQFLYSKKSEQSRLDS